MSAVVSIILPTYNRARFLAEAIASVHAQTYPHWHVIVVDDGSTDDSLAVVPPDSRLTVVRRPHSGNIAAVRNRGLDVATGTYVGFLDSDDRWHPEKLGLQVAALEDDMAAGWCHGASQLIDVAGRPRAMRAGEPWRPREGRFLEAVLTTESSIALQTVLVRRELAQEIRFDERIPTVDDYDFLVQLAMRAPAVAVKHRVLADIRQHDARTTLGRYDHGLGSAMAYRKAHRQLTDRHLRRVCLRQGTALLRHYLANARARGELIKGLLRAYRQLRAV